MSESIVDPTLVETAPEPVLEDEAPAEGAPEIDYTVYVAQI